MKQIRILQIYSFFFIAIVFVACTQRKGPEVNKIQLDIKIERFDIALGKLEPARLQSQTPAMQKQYGSFYSDYMSGILQAGSTSDPAYLKNLALILNDKDYVALKQETERVFPSLEMQEKQLADVFKHIKYYYPQQPIPRIISFISGFAVQIPIGKDYLGIGLDMFLGANSKFYPALRQSIPHYLTRRFTPENITPRALESFVREEMFPEPDSLHSFLDRIVYNGKIMFAMQQFMPQAPDSLLIGYTAAQQQWATKYEADIWGFFLQENLLYETDYMKIQKYFGEAPFTPGLGSGQESAPKLGIFCGWQIVKKYMDENPGVSLQRLMADNDAQEILNASHYKPK